MNFSDYRLRVMDYLLSSGRKINSRKEFVSLLNDLVTAKGGDEIGEDMLSKYIKSLNELADVDNVTVKFTVSDGYHYTQKGYKVFEDFISDDDKQLFTIAASVFGLFAGSPLQEKFSQTVQKVLSENASGTLRKVTEQIVAFNAVQNDSGAIWIHPLLTAIIEGRTLLMTYKSMRDTVERKRVVSPYLLKQFHDRWYLVAYAHQSSSPHKTLVFSLSSIRNVENCDEPYFVDPDFSPTDYFKYSIGVWHWHEKAPERIQLEFNDFIAQIQANPLHHSQKATLTNDGKSLLIDLYVYTSPELEMLILSYGPAVKVLKPAWLAEKVISSAKAVLSLYDNKIIG